MKKRVELEVIRADKVRPGDVLWDNNGTFREVERLGEDWVHEPSGDSGPTILFRLGVSATIQLTGACSSKMLRKPASSRGVSEK